MATTLLAAAGVVPAFLTQAKQAFLKGPSAGVPESCRPTIVIGNSAGDLDTIVSAVGVAVARSAQSARDDLPKVVVPVVPFRRVEFRLRQDACLVFRHCGIEFDAEGAPSSLLFIDEVTPAALARWAAMAEGGEAAKPFDVVLTDHNRVTTDVSARFGERIVAIVDHHSDEGAHAESCPMGSRDRVVDIAAGSAASLAAELCLSVDGGPESVASQAAVSPTLAALLLSAIAVDTRGFAPDQRKFSGRDVRAASLLLQVLGTVDAHGAGQALPTAAAAADVVLDMADRLRATSLPATAAADGAASVKALAKRLLDARYEVQHLRAADLLALDYKEACVGPAEGPRYRLGCAAVFTSMGDFIDRAGGPAGLAAVMAQFGEERGVDVVMAITAAPAKKALARARVRQEAERPQPEPGPELKGVAICPAPGPSRRQATAAVALCRALEKAPVGLPPPLLAEPLFVQQGVEAQGFGLRFIDAARFVAGQWTSSAGAGPDRVAGEDAKGPVRVSALRREITRKTLLPATTALLAGLAAAERELE